MRDLEQIAEMLGDPTITAKTNGEGVNVLVKRETGETHKTWQTRTAGIADSLSANFLDKDRYNPFDQEGCVRVANSRFNGGRIVLLTDSQLTSNTLLALNNGSTPFDAINAMQHIENIYDTNLARDMAHQSIITEPQAMLTEPDPYNELTLD